MNSKRKNSYTVKMICGMGIFAALAIVVAFATSFIKVDFLSFDAKDAVIVLASFIYGPVSGVIISAVTAVVEFLTFSATGPWGMLMNFVSSATFSFVASFVYSRRKSFNFAIIGIFVAVVATTGVMLLMNILITPLYTGAPTSAIIEMIPIMLLPFNFAKALFNGGAVLLLYKPLVRAMRNARLVPPSARKSEPKGAKDGAAISRRLSSTMLSIIVGGVMVLIAVVALVILVILAT